MAPQLTAGEECQQAAKILSSFADPTQGAITAAFITSAMGIGVFRGDQGVAVVRLKSGEWSAPCAITWENAGGSIQSAQDTVLLFMTEAAIFSLVSRTPLVLGRTHRFVPGPLYGNALNLDATVDVYAYVRFNAGFTPSDLISAHMAGWSVREDATRHAAWHGQDVTWFDVLANRISVDRSSVGNALYLILNMAAKGVSTIAQDKRNYADLDKVVGVAPSYASTQAQRQQQAQQGMTGSGSAASLNALAEQQQQQQQQAAAAYQQMLLEQQQQQQQLAMLHQAQQATILQQPAALGGGGGGALGGVGVGLGAFGGLPQTIAQTTAIPPHAQQMYNMQPVLQAQQQQAQQFQQQQQQQPVLGMGMGYAPMGGMQPVAGMNAMGGGMGMQGVGMGMSGGVGVGGSGMGGLTLLQQQQLLLQQQQQQLQQQLGGGVGVGGQPGQQQMGYGATGNASGSVPTWNAYGL